MIVLSVQPVTVRIASHGKHLMFASDYTILMKLRHPCVSRRILTFPTAPSHSQSPVPLPDLWSKKKRTLVCFIYSLITFQLNCYFCASISFRLMRNTSARVFAFLSFLPVLFSHNECQELCDIVPECANATHAWGSYCKAYQTTSVCFGLYFVNNNKSQVCFQPNNASCNETYPVPCSPAHQFWYLLQ